MHLPPRLRFPIVNKAEHVVRLHRKLGIISSSFPDKFNTLISLIRQFGIKDALMLDVTSSKLTTKMLKLPAKRNILQIKHANRPLNEKDDADVEVIIRDHSRKAIRLHNSMTNQLTRLCKDRKSVV